MPNMKTRNALLLAKVESTEAVDSSPVPTTDAISVENISFTPAADTVQTNESTASLDGQGSIVGGMRATLNFDVPLKGSGTVSTAPEWGRLMTFCGWAETITAAAVPVAAEALAAGGSTSTAVLGTTAVATAQLYRGMPVVFTGTVTGTSFISDYTVGKLATLTDLLGGALVATSNYQILANVRYAPVSSSAPPSATIYLYIDGLRYRLYGARGSVSLRVDTAGIGRLSFQFQAMYGDKADITMPTTGVFDAPRPPVFRAGAFLIQRKKGAVAQFSLDSGNNLVMPANPNSTEGFDPAEITMRNITGSMNPLEVLIATRDMMTDFKAGNKSILHARYGTTAGNRIAVTCPSGLFTGHSPSDRDGLQAVDVPFEATGRDAGAFLTIW